QKARKRISCLRVGCREGRLEITEFVARRGVRPVESRKLGMPPLKPEAERMACLNPRNTVSDYKAVRNSDVEIVGAKSLVTDTERVGVKSEGGEKHSAGIGNSKCLWPVLPGKAIPPAGVIQPVKAHVEVIEQGIADGSVPAEAKIVGKARLEKVR